MRVNLKTLLIVVLGMFAGGSLRGQSPNASISGVVLDPDKKSIADAEILVVNDYTRVQYEAKTNTEGFFAVSNLPPGQYRIQVSKVGFKAIIKPDIILNVQDALAITFTLPIGASSVVVTVEGGAPMINTTDASVSTVVDRQFAENLPLNGRSFQTLIQLTPGVVLTPSNSFDSGQFSVNGQRAASNYWMVDGVSANVGIGISDIGTSGNGLSGALGSFSAQGGTNSLVSVDALQEFRILTSTYAPEFGRTPGAQISIVTRSGTNQFHGAAFEYLRNDLLDANDWFADRAGLAKPQERQNDFGGVLGGPIVRDRTFFFFSYEGLRLRLPQVEESLVPDLAARQQAVPAMQPYLNAFPLPSPDTQDDLANQIGQFNASFSNRASLDATSLRVDHRINNQLTLFGRYNYSPSENIQRGNPRAGVSLNTIVSSKISLQTATFGVSWSPSQSVVNDLRFNYSRTNAISNAHLDNFGGAIPLPGLPFPAPFTSADAFFSVGIDSLGGGGLAAGANPGYLQRQLNLVDGFSVQTGRHSLKFGADFRRMSPVIHNQRYSQDADFSDVPSAADGNVFFSFLTSGLDATILFHNLGVFAQDTWRVTPRLTFTYGLRWDVDFAPSSLTGPSLPAVTGFHLNDLSELALAPAGTPVFGTTYGNVAPRIGVAYGLSRDPRWGAVVRSGFGVFYDLATSEVGNFNFSSYYPFAGQSFNFGGSFPFDAATAAPPPITVANLSSGVLFASDPHLNLPYTLEWNVSVEQSLGGQQSLTASYVGAVGRRLLQSASVVAPNTSFRNAMLVTNAATSDYQALQTQFQRRLSHGFQVLASYTWSHSIDTGSAGSVFGNESNALVSRVDVNANRGPSDFDIRNAISAGLTYDLALHRGKAVLRTVLNGWSTQNIVQARSAAPVNLYYSNLVAIFSQRTQIRPDIVDGQPVYLSGSLYPGGKAFNPMAFAAPPIDPVTHQPLRQGDLGRNALRGLGAAQWDLAIHRDFPIHESLKLQFRAELFNVLNHPNFGSPVGNLSNVTQFGQSTQMLGRSLDQNAGGGSFNSLYEIGGPRSVQLALKLMF